VGRLAALREAIPNICLQMLLRGRNTVANAVSGHRHERFIAEATATGIDIYRISTRSTTSNPCGQRSMPYAKPARRSRSRDELHR